MPGRAEVDRRARPEGWRWSRAWLVSCAVHLAVALAIRLTAAPRPHPDLDPVRPPETVTVTAVEDELPPPPAVETAPAVEVAVAGPPGRSGRMAAGEPAAPAAPAVARPRAPRSRSAVPPPEPPPVSPAVAVPEAVDQAAAIPEAEATLAAVAPNLSPPPAELPEPPLDRPPEGDAGGGRRQGAESGSAIVGRGDTGTGPGAGGDGDGAGGGDVFLGGELHARVQGDEHETIVERGDGPAFISDKRATELRTRDYFPRLPGERWPQRRPYVVVLDVCVAGDGTVSDAALRSSASRTLDPIVRAAAKTWRYSPHLVDGRPTPFCHRVVIRYERW